MRAGNIRASFQRGKDDRQIGNPAVRLLDIEGGFDKIMYESI